MIGLVTPADADEIAARIACTLPRRARLVREQSAHADCYAFAGTTLLAERGFRSAYASITLPNEASVGPNRAMGFEPVGLCRDASHKLGRWHDVSWHQLALQSGAPRAVEHPAVPLWGDAVFGRQRPLWSVTEWSHAG